MTKVCPKCNEQYADASFEFCLNDGTRLLAVRKANDDEPETHFGSRWNSDHKTQNAAPSINQKGFSNDWQPLQNQETLISDLPAPDAQPSRLNADQSFSNSSANSSVVGTTLTAVGENKAAGIVAIVLALAHNYWQWLYLARANSFEFANFAIWFLLLLAGTIVCLAVLRFNRTGKGYAVVGLVMLAINLLLYFVPRR